MFVFSVFRRTYLGNGEAVGVKARLEAWGSLGLSPCLLSGIYGVFSRERLVWYPGRGLSAPCDPPQFLVGDSCAPGFERSNGMARPRRSLSVERFVPSSMRRAHVSSSSHRLKKRRPECATCRDRSRRPEAKWRPTGSVSVGSSAHSGAPRPRWGRGPRPPGRTSKQEWK